jgi:glycosyltransferase involved in cell wall biosynthesis
MSALDRTIRLCLASTHFFPTHGGAQLRFLRYIPGLRKRNVFTHVLAGTPKQKKRLVDIGFSEESDPGVKDLGLEKELIDQVSIQRVNIPGQAGWRRSVVFNQAIVRFCLRSDSKPDIVQIVSSLQPRSIPWVRHLRKKGIPVVYAYTIPLNFPSNPLRRAIRKWSLKRLYSQLDCVVANSEVMGSLTSDLMAKTRLEIIPNGVDLQRYRPAFNEEERKALRASFGLVGEGSKMITTVGAIHPRKGSDLLLESWVRLAKQFPGAHLFMVGLRKDLQYPKLGDFRSRLGELLAVSGAADRVHFTGVVRNIEVYLRASDVFVFPSMREGMPNAVLEAMATGIPVILTPFQGLSKDLGQPDREFLLVNRDPETLASAVANVLSGNGVGRRLGERARRWATETMDLEKSLDRYAALYRELALEPGVRNKARVVN